MELEALVPAEQPYLCADARAPALVLAPGLGMDGLGFIRQLPLGAVADLHLFQTPNEATEGEDGLGHFAWHVEAYIQARRLDQRAGGVVLGGCSMGGAVSLAVAIRGRVKLRGLILIGSFGNCAHVSWPLRMWGPLLARCLPFGLARRFVRQVVARTHFFGRIAPGEADWLVSCKLDRTRGYYIRAAIGLTRQDQIAAARSLTVPTLVLHGTRDHVLPHKAGVELARNIPGARLVTVEDSGHAVFFTHHGIVNAEIAAFLRGLP
ncbi:MAG: alpha/beta hydrolase [Planctomycetota bacterium]|nr:alpha/beta hydrolase [Planctomycetota bacterium]